MPIDLHELGRKCHRLRTEILHIALDRAAELTGIRSERLAAIEAGDLQPTGDEVLILADVYGEPVDYFITNERSVSIDKASDLYRMYGDTFSSSDRQNIQQFLKLCRMEHEIESLLGGRPRVIKFRPGPQHKHMKTHGRQAAEKLRGDIQIDAKPLENPFHLARRLGCHIFRRNLHNSRVSGLMLRHDDVGSCILVNYSEDLFRQNFSAAHELCHALLDDDCTVTVSFERADEEIREDRKRREWRANSFASHLLFPHRARLQINLGSTTDERTTAIRHAARIYRVNPVVVLYALKEAGRLAKGEVDALAPGLNLARNQKQDADLAKEARRVQDRRLRHLQAGLSPEYVETCVKAYREGEISMGKLAEALLASPVELPGILSDLGYDVTSGEISA